MRFNIDNADREDIVAYVIVYSREGNVLKALAIDKEFASYIHRGHERAGFLLDDIDPAVLDLTPCGDATGCGPNGVCYGCHYDTACRFNNIADGIDPLYVIE